MMIDFESGSDRLWQEQQRTSPAGLPSFLAFVVCLVGLAVVLAWLAGPPHLPETALTAAELGRMLTAPTISDDEIVYLASSLAWLALAYLSVSVLLRACVVLLLSVCGGTRIARRLLRLSDLVTLPFVRRFTDGAAAGLVLASAWLPSTSKVRATALAEVTASVATTAPVSPALPVWTLNLAPDAVGAAPTVQVAVPERDALPYTVVAGDTLWKIAQRLYGDGDRFPELFAANAGKTMPDGETFASPELIRPGWILDVPLPAASVVVDGGVLVYRVQPGDSLLGIAARFLGESLRWPEIWDLNHGRAMGGGRTFSDPDLILPGWTLALPAAAVPLAPSTPISEEPPTTPPTAPTPRPTAPPITSPESRP